MTNIPKGLLVVSCCRCLFLEAFADYIVASRCCYEMLIIDC